ncbi:MAG: hypothetical protein COA70_05185 [Planctomycetota bacterium]|nr:MAG: hypothetical protein COA70_05185 [Planctomycetota bacterium]
MKFHSLVLRNLRRRPLASWLTGLSVSLGVGLFATVGALREASEVGFQRSASMCDMLVGAKGSSLQLTLNALYHMGQSQGNLPFEAYQEIAETPGVLWSVPLAVGDSYRGHRIVGITGNFFTDLKLLSLGEEDPLEFSSGHGFEYSHQDFVALKEELAAEHDDHDGHGAGQSEGGHDELHDAKMFRAVLGSEAALRTGLKVGDHFHPSHGVEGVSKSHEDGESEIVGVLAPTGTPIDRAILIPIGAYYVLEGHEPVEGMKEGGARDPRGLSAVMLRTKAGFYRTRIYRSVNDRLDTMAVYPSVEVRNLFAILGAGDLILRWITALIVVVALIGVMVAIYNTMGSRRREFAVLRALGARRRTILGLVTCESALLALLGGLAGLGFAGALIYAISGQVQMQTGVSLSPVFGFAELQLILAVTLAGALAGLVPALSAYRTEAAHILSSNV